MTLSFKMIEVAESLARSVQRDEKKWYAIYVRSRFEKKVDKLLQEKEVETFLPLIETIRKWSDRRKRVEEPLFKGYVFVRINLNHRLPVLQTDGVVRLVGIRNTPSAIPDTEIDWIKKALRTDGLEPKEVRKENLPALGERVEVIAGSLRGVRGIVSQQRGKTRLIIEVQAIARAFSIEVPPHLLKRL